MKMRRMEMMLLRLRLRWIGWRLRRRTLVDVNAIHGRADAARKRARERALLIDDDITEADRLGDDAFNSALDESGRKESRNPPESEDF
jgi:hypothetical protein